MSTGIQSRSFKARGAPPRRRASLWWLALAALGAVRAAGLEFVKVPGSAVWLKVVGLSDDVAATAEPDGGPAVFQLETLRSYHVIEERRDRYRIVEEPRPGAARGWVPKARVTPWSTREGLHFNRASFLIDETPLIAAWKDRDTLVQYALTGDQERFGPAYRERVEARALPEQLRPFPVVGQAHLTTAAGDPISAFRVLMPLVLTDGVVETAMTADEIVEVLGAVTFCIAFDTASAKPGLAAEMAAGIAGVLRDLGGAAAGVRAGLVLFHGSHRAAAPYTIHQPAPLDAAAAALVRAVGDRTERGERAAPVLDIVALSTTELAWRPPSSRGGHRKVLIVVADSDARPATVGLGGSVPAGRDIAWVTDRLRAAEITVYALQAGAGDLGSLRAVLARLAIATGGEYYPYRGDAHTTRRGFATHLQQLVARTVHTSRTVAERLASHAETRDRLSFIPLHVLDPAQLATLRAASPGLRVRDRGLLVREAWVLDNDDLFERRILIDKATLGWLARFFSLVADGTVDLEVLRASVREVLESFLGESFDDDVEVQELIEKRMGVHFRTHLLGFSLESMAWLSPRERFLYQRRIGEAGERLSSFLESASAAFDRTGEVWMPIALLP